MKMIEKNMFFVRILFVTPYFDDIEDIFKQKKDEKIITRYIKNINNYEKELEKLYNIIRKSS